MNILSYEVSTQRGHGHTYGSLRWERRTGNWLLDVTIKHGYQPLRAVGMLLAVYAVALLLLSDP